MKTEPIAVNVAALAVVDVAAIRAAMPPQAVELVDLMCFADAITICQKLGGQRLNIPLELNEKNPGSAYLIEHLGRELAERLVGVRGNAPFEVPMLTAVERLLRDNAIRAEFDTGTSVRLLSSRYRISTRHIRTVLAASPVTTPRQPRGQAVYDPFTLPLFQDEQFSAAA